jgi:hypothetical protein
MPKTLCVHGAEIVNSNLTILLIYDEEKRY